MIRGRSYDSGYRVERMRNGREQRTKPIKLSGIFSPKFTTHNTGILLSPFASIPLLPRGKEYGDVRTHEQTQPQRFFLGSSIGLLCGGLVVMPPQELEDQARLTTDELRDVWMALSPDERLEAFRVLPRVEAEGFFMTLPAHDVAEIVLGLPPEERRSWLRLVPPDDVADLIQHAPHEEREHLLGLLDEPTRREVAGLPA